MKRLIAIFLAVAAITAVHAQDMDEVAEFMLRLDDFDSLVVLDNLNVEYCYTACPDSAGMATFSCSRRKASELIFENRKNRLRIQHADDGQIVPEGMPLITVYSSGIKSLSNGGDSTLVARNLPPTPSLKLRVIGNGTIIATGIHATSVDASITTGCGHLVLTGRTNSANFSNVGTGPIEAGCLQAAQVKCQVYGTGTVDCFATERLSVSGMGSSRIFYKGNPPKISNHTIGVKLIPIGE